MNPGFVTHIHGVPVQHVEIQLRELLQVDDLRFHTSKALGGMTNLDLIARSGDAKLVFKFPSIKKDFSDNPYLHEFTTMVYFSKRELCPKPLATGFVDLSSNIPFLAYFFESGYVHSSTKQISLPQWNSLLNSLETIHGSLPPDTKEIDTPTEFLSSLTASVLDLDLNSCSPMLRELHSRFSSAVMYLHDYIVNWTWTNSTIHGDLRLSNILFQDNQALLLDWAHCSRASHLFDFAYFCIEPMKEQRFQTETPFKLEKHETRNRMEALALVSVLSWTIERLYYVELDMVDPFLLDSDLPVSLITYAKSKQRKLDLIQKDLAP